MTLGALVNGTLQLLWPARCAACDRSTPDGTIFCDECTPSLSVLLGACPGCALPRADWNALRGRCGLCRRIPFSFCEARAAYEYGAALADAIVRMKHGQRWMARRLGPLLVPALMDALARGGFGADDVVVPVPLHARRLRERGFNQALELVRAALRDIARTRALVVAMPRGLPRLERRLLRRTRATKALGHAGPAARMAEVAGAFALAPAAAERVRFRRVLLVDDVLTTGATANECAGALMAAGARDVHVLALARAV
ncbi:MAG TPA: ComF family protein [Polyangia bacterium]|nr:ComF family protein [Polyangia bacterium]